jgi:hypothetical protein
MGKVRTNRKRPGDQKSSRHQNSLQSRRAVILIETVCFLAGSEHLIAGRSDKSAQHLQAAIKDHDTASLFEWLVETFSFQGISDQAAAAYMELHGVVRWRDIESCIPVADQCHKLESHWSFHGCGYKKSSGTCGAPKKLPSCPLPQHDLRNGRINQTAYGLFFFLRDITNGDLVSWIDERLRHEAQGNGADRLTRMREALI